MPRSLVGARPRRSLSVGGVAVRRGGNRCGGAHPGAAWPPCCARRRCCGSDEPVTDRNDQLNGVVGCLVRRAVRSPRARIERRVTLDAVAGDKFGHPPFRDPVLASDVSLAATLDDNGGDDKTSFGHPPTSKRPRLSIADGRFRCRETSVSYVLSADTVVRSTKSPGQRPSPEGVSSFSDSRFN